MEKEVKRAQMIDKIFSPSILDYVFPWHMYLGKKEKRVVPNDDEGGVDESIFDYTPFKLFNRRRTFLVWLHSDKVAYLFNEEEKKRIHAAEKTVFRWSIGMKAASLFFLTNLRFFRRPATRAWSYDLMLIYLSIYSFLGSNIPGVYLTWPMYSDYCQRMFESEKMRKRGLRNMNSFLDRTSLDGYKCYYYLYDIELARYY